MNYQKKTQITLQTLKDNGYKFVSIANFFDSVGYKGINIKLTDKEGNKLELQIHTEESLTAKEKAHKLYEKQRTLPENSLKYKQLDNQMFSIFNSVPLPDLKKLSDTIEKFV